MLMKLDRAGSSARTGELHLDSGAAERIMKWLGTVYNLPVIWHDRWVERQQLRELDRRTMRDIGLTREVLERELRKPFWRA